MNVALAPISTLSPAGSEVIAGGTPVEVTFSTVSTLATELTTLLIVTL